MTSDTRLSRLSWIGGVSSGVSILVRKNVGCDVRVARFLQYNIYSSGIELEMFAYFNKARIIRLI